jgi:hypothetical protein
VKNDTVAYAHQCFVYVIAAALTLLAIGFWHFQVAQSSRLRRTADKNRFKQIPLIARRADSRPRRTAISR